MTSSATDPVTVRRIVVNIPAASPGEVARFYEDVFCLSRPMDMGWIVTLATEGEGPAQVAFAKEGGSGTELPALSIEVDDLDAALARARAAGAEPVYGPVLEPWGVRRFYLRDPTGTLINVLSHSTS